MDLADRVARPLLGHVAHHQRREPQVLLKDGDRVVVEIEKVGRLENPVAAE